MMTTSWLIFFEVRLLHNQLKNPQFGPNHVTSGHPILDVKRGTGGGEHPAHGDFWKLVTKTMHFRHISAKLQPQIWNNISIGG